MPAGSFYCFRAYSCDPGRQNLHDPAEISPGAWLWCLSVIDNQLSGTRESTGHNTRGFVSCTSPVLVPKESYPAYCGQNNFSHGAQYIAVMSLVPNILITFDMTDHRLCLTQATVDHAKFIGEIIY